MASILFRPQWQNSENQWSALNKEGYQEFMKKSRENANKIYWEKTNKLIKSLLKVHREQGEKTKPFPYDLAKKMQYYNKNEQKSYSFYKIYSHDVYDHDQTIQNSINSIQKEREKEHNRISYLLDLHDKKGKTNPFPYDLSKRLNLNLSLLKKSQAFDKEYSYEREMQLIEYKEGYLDFRFLAEPEGYEDVEANLTSLFLDTEIDNNISESLLNNLINDEGSKVANSEYILWKSRCYDSNYNYERKNSKEEYDPDYGYETDTSEPDYDQFNDFELV